MKDLGVAVIGFARPELMRNVLTSLERQGALPATHVFIDGDALRAELYGLASATVEAARAFEVADLRANIGHLGIEKLMLDALSLMSTRYRKIVVLEDDCFPTRDAVAVFSELLDEVSADPSVYSVYGHHFLSPSECDRISRFQGWGWATTAAKLEPVLAELKARFSMPEREYLEWTQASLTPEICARLDVTPGRDVIKVLKQFYSWDSCTSLVTAQRGLLHRRSPKRIIYNCGLTPGHGHFTAPQKHLREPPFNMIEPGEVWDYW